jgi:hypothetical protein
MFLMMVKMLKIVITMFHDISHNQGHFCPTPSNLTPCLPSPLNLKKSNFFRRVFCKATPIPNKIALFSIKSSINLLKYYYKSLLAKFGITGSQY